MRNNSAHETRRLSAKTAFGKVCTIYIQNWDIQNKIGLGNLVIDLPQLIRIYLMAFALKPFIDG